MPARGSCSPSRPYPFPVYPAHTCTYPRMSASLGGASASPLPASRASPRRLGGTFVRQPPLFPAPASPFPASSLLCSSGASIRARASLPVAVSCPSPWQSPHSASPLPVPGEGTPCSRGKSWNEIYHHTADKERHRRLVCLAAAIAVFADAAAVVTSDLADFVQSTGPMLDFCWCITSFIWWLFFLFLYYLFGFNFVSIWSNCMW